MSWLLKLFSRDPDQETRIAAAHAQRADAAEELADAREVNGRLRKHASENHFGDRIAAAFAANDRQGRHA